MNYSRVINPCVTKNKPYEVSVQSGLSYSPADIQRLTTENRAVKLTELQSFMEHDNIPVNDDIPPDLRRGVDENDLWNDAGSTYSMLSDFEKSKKHVSKQTQND